VRVRGECVFVEVEYDGSSLASDHAVGATVLNLENDDDFTEVGLLEVGYDQGDGSVSWTRFGYTFDEDLGAVVLDTPLAVAAPAETDVRTLTDGAAVEVRRYMAVDLGDGGDPAEADIKSGDRGIAPVGDSRAGSLVELDSLGDGEYEFVRFLTEEPDTDPATILTPAYSGFLPADVLVAHAAVTPVTMQTSYVNGGMYTGVDGWIHVPKDGFYDVVMTGSWANNSGGSRYAILQVLPFNLSVESRRIVVAAPAPVGTTSHQVVGKLYLFAGMAVRLAVQQNSGAGLSLLGRAAGDLTGVEIVQAAA
jgi:hypothetical protein